MLPTINPTQTQAWQDLHAHFQQLRHLPISHLFDTDANRASSFSIINNHLLYDYSKNLLTQDTLDLFLKLAQEVKLKEAIGSFKQGEKINSTEQRQALHFLLRAETNLNLAPRLQPFMQEINSTHQRMKDFVNNLHAKRFKGYTGKPIKYIVNIGIGGSDLGAKMIVQGLQAFWKKGMHCFFISNIDGAHVQDILSQITPEESLFIIISKSFTTQETLTNAESIRQWFLKQTKDAEAIKHHFIAVSANYEAVLAFGIDKKHIFMFWDWIGGRYSLWSSVGISIALMIGYEAFTELLQGAASADEHFFNTPLLKNIPFIMAILGLWYRNFLRYNTYALIPYDQSLSFFPQYLQQLEMESNGKSIDRNQQALTYDTSPIIFGATGTDVQHSFFQLLHQGTSIVPIDFIVPIQSASPIGDHHQKLVANCFAQSRALMYGRTIKEVKTNHSNNALYDIYKVCAGNRPSNTFLLERINPFNLGQLIAFYEHKVFVQGILWNIYSFDQFGVELGKDICQSILASIQKGDNALCQYDSSTKQLIQFYKQHH